MYSSEILPILSRLIATPSVNPAHSADSNIHGEKRMALLLADLFRERGLEVEMLFPMGEDRPAVLGKSRPQTVHRTLMFEMHLDTVGVADMTISPFESTQRDDRIYGRGSCDMKGSMAALFAVLTRERIETLARKGIQLLLVGAPDEETGLGGSTRLAAEGLGADWAVILEPTRCLPVIAHKGALWYEVELRGRSGHGSQPDKGVSTNAALADFLPNLLRIHGDLAAAYAHPLLGHSSLNIGRIVGGQTFNIIPERTLLQLDRRVIPNEPSELFPERVSAAIASLIEQGKLLGGSCTLTNQTDAFATDEDSEWVRALQRSITRVTGEPAPCSGTSWVSDASPFSKTCGQVLVFGPGDIAQAHTDNEYIEISQLETAAAVFAEFLDHGVDG
ncbi:MAG: M20 family metallopeptidase [Kiritimatiellia bacterium]